MPESTIQPMRELRVWLRDSDYRALKAQAERDGLSQSEAVRQAVAKYLGEDAAGQSAPWLESMLDAVLAKYFQGFPQVLDRLVVGAFEQRHLSGTIFSKLIQVADHETDLRKQDERWTKLLDQVKPAARQQADEFFQSLSESSEFIEPPPDPDDA